MQYKNITARDQTLTHDLPPPPIALLATRFARAELAALGRRTQRALGFRRPQDIELAALGVPDSAIAQQATEIARAAEPAYMFNHSVRTYLFGLAIGEHLGLRADREVLYVASVLHDLALAPGHDGPESFELEGARKAHDIALDAGMDQTRAALVHEAIALHTSVGIADKREPEVALVHFGAGLDVIGFHAEDVSAATRRAIVEAWPRHAMKEAFAQRLETEVAHKPGCHFRGHARLGFAMKVRQAPFAE
ncbi:MAG: HD domain-containing protein [Sandaracinaceae bacterium]|nr:HD domain-containing protein [Sandaracinaceae bacterium]